MARKSNLDKERDILKEASGNIGSWYSYYDVNLTNYREDTQFLFVTQWTDTERREFAGANKPILTFNKTYDFFKKVVGDQRQNTPNLKVRCLDGDCSQEAINLRSNIVRQIAFSSKSDIVYQTAFETMLAGGIGGIRVLVDYSDSKSFDQHILLKRIDNPERLFFDPGAQEPTKCDGDFCGYYDSMSKAEFEKKYPDIPYPQSFPSYGNLYEFSWGNEDKITVAEYYRKEWFEFTLYRLSDGRTVTDKQYQKIVKNYEHNMLAEDLDQIDSALILPEIIETRKSRDYKIMCYKMIYNKIIEKYKVPGKEFPLVFVPGDTHKVDGEERTISFVRYVKDPQRLLNYCNSEIAQALKNNRREQFLVTPDNISGQGIVDMWRNPAIQQGALVAKPDPKTGQMPIKLPASEVPQSLLAHARQAEMDMQSVLGFYEANRGSSGQELSGVALKERQRTGNLGVAVYVDNLNRAIEQTGRVIMSMIPEIYDTERKVFMQMPDGSVTQVVVNREFAGGKKENDLTKGKYDVVIEAGPNFAIQREQALNLLIDMVKINPQTFPLVADLVAENIDIENNPQLVERFKTLVPPNILAKESGQPPPPPQPDPMQMLAQEQLKLKQAELALKQQEQRLDAEQALRQQQLDAAKTELEMEKLNIDRDVASIRAGAEVGKARLNYETDMANALSKILNAHSEITKQNHETARELIK